MELESNQGDRSNYREANGHFFELEFIIVEHLLMNRKHWERLNLDNPNEKAVGIAKETLNKFLKAVPFTDSIANEEELFKAMGDIQGKEGEHHHQASREAGW